MSGNNFYDKSYFDGGLKKSNFGVYIKQPHFKFLAKEIDLLFRPKSLLELGCAKGYFIEEARKLGIDAYGVDVSSYAISASPKKIRDYLAVYDGTNLPIDRKYDIVYSFDVLEHIPEQQVDALIGRLSEISDCQFHIITNRELHPGADKSHVSLHPMDWWEERFSKHFKNMEKVFLIESIDHWVQDLNKINSLSLKLKNENNVLLEQNKDLRVALKNKEDYIKRFQNSKLYKISKGLKRLVYGK